MKRCFVGLFLCLERYFSRGGITTGTYFFPRVQSIIDSANVNGKEEVHNVSWQPRVRDEYDTRSSIPARFLALSTLQVVSLRSLRLLLVRSCFFSLIIYRWKVHGKKEECQISMFLRKRECLSQYTVHVKRIEKDNSYKLSNYSYKRMLFMLYFRLWDIKNFLMAANLLKLLKY